MKKTTGICIAAALFISINSITYASGTGQAGAQASEQSAAEAQAVTEAAVQEATEAAVQEATEAAEQEVTEAAVQAAAETEADEQDQISMELLEKLNRSELKGLGEIEGPIYVFGHQAPDSDTVCTSIVYAYILRELGYDAQPAILDKINSETAYILDSAGVSTPQMLDDASGKNVVLIDHSEKVQSAQGLDSANILMVIDHHGVGSVTTGKPIIFDARPIGSTAAIAWIRSINYGVKLDRQMSTLLVGAILSDTNNLKSETTTDADREAVRFLSEKAGIDDINAFYQEIYKASISYAGMTDEEIVMSDIRQYETEGNSYVIGIAQIYSKDEAPDMIERMKAVLPGAIELKGADFGYVQVSIYHDDVSVSYFIPSDDRAAELLDTALGDEGKWEDGVYVMEPGISRKKVLVPKLTEALSLHPKE